MDVDSKGPLPRKIFPRNPLDSRNQSIIARAYDIEHTLKGSRGPVDWDALVDGNLAAAFQKVTHTQWKQYIEPYCELFRLALNDPDFPKRSPKAQLEFIATSIAGPSWVGKDEHGNYRLNLRSSRDICQKTPVNRIIRREPYIVCECGYDGPALRNGCPECGAEQNPDWLC